MKVRYRSILKEIDEIAYNALDRHRTIESIELTRPEWREFKSEFLRAKFYISPNTFTEKEILYQGIKIVCGTH